MLFFCWNWLALSDSNTWLINGLNYPTILSFGKCPYNLKVFVLFFMLFSQRPMPHSAASSLRVTFFCLVDSSTNDWWTADTWWASFVQTLVQVPDLPQLQSLVDRLKNVGDLLTVAVTQYGDLHLQVSTSLVTVGSEFRKLRVIGDRGKIWHWLV